MRISHLTTNTKLITEGWNDPRMTLLETKVIQPWVGDIERYVVYNKDEDSFSGDELLATGILKILKLILTAPVVIEQVLVKVLMLLNFLSKQLSGLMVKLKS